MNAPTSTTTRWAGVPAHAAILSAPNGEIAIWTVNETLLRSSLRGHLSKPLMEQAIAALQSRLGTRAVRIFHDWSAYTGHDAAARAVATQWAFDIRKRIASLDILLPPPNKMMSMAISASNLLLGGFMTIHHDRASFERALTRALAG